MENVNLTLSLNSKPMLTKWMLSASLNMTPPTNLRQEIVTTRRPKLWSRGGEGVAIWNKSSHPSSIYRAWSDDFQESSCSGPYKRPLTSAWIKSVPVIECIEETEPDQDTLDVAFAADEAKWFDCFRLGRNVFGLQVSANLKFKGSLECTLLRFLMKNYETSTGELSIFLTLCLKKKWKGNQV